MTLQTCVEKEPEEPAAVAPGQSNNRTSGSLQKLWARPPGPPQHHVPPADLFLCTRAGCRFTVSPPCFCVLFWGKAAELHTDVTMFLTRTFCSRRLPVLTLFTKDPCPLCDEAKELLQPFTHRIVFETVDITKPENKRFWVQYRYHIPVFHLNGTEIMRHRLDPHRLEELLKQVENHV
uniref:Glutaredoxin-like protein n=1 Tax=Knipowitschia caucasica TaxID=637954 RepID=A0AAV2JCZ6_KNICA